MPSPEKPLARILAFLVVAGLTAACATSPRPDSPAIRELPPAEADRFRALRENSRARRSRCEAWRAEWMAFETHRHRRNPPRSEIAARLSPAERRKLETLIAEYPEETSDARQGWEIYAAHQKEFDDPNLPLLNWVEAYSATAGCALAGYWNALKALSGEPRKPDPRATARFRELIREMHPKLLGLSGMDGAPTSFRIYIALLERAHAANRFILPRSAREELAAIKAEERDLTAEFRRREGAYWNILFQDLPARTNPSESITALEPGNLRSAAALAAYRDYGREAFAYEARLRSGPYSRLKAWVAKSVENL